MSARWSDAALRSWLTGYGYEPLFVEGDDPESDGEHCIEHEEESCAGLLREHEPHRETKHCKWHRARDGRDGEGLEHRGMRRVEHVHELKRRDERGEARATQLRHRPKEHDPQGGHEGEVEEAEHGD